MIDIIFINDWPFYILSGVYALLSITMIITLVCSLIKSNRPKRIMFHQKLKLYAPDLPKG